MLTGKTHELERGREELINDSPKVSVITCFLNEERFLTEAVESVLRQEYTHWELILIDDGSSDKSTVIAKSFASEFSKIKYFDHKDHANKGLSASRNLAIDLAEGEIIAFLDGDDVWLPGFLATGIHTMLNHSSPMYCEATFYWNSWDDLEAEDEIIAVGTDQDQLHGHPDLIFKLYPLGSGAAPCLCGILVDKETLGKHGCFDEAFKGMYEDQVFLTKFYLHESVYISSNCNNLYRQREGSLVNASHAHGTYNKHRRFFLEWLDQYIQVNAAENRELRNLLSSVQFPFNHPTSYRLISYYRSLKKRISKFL
ncbi:MAG: glycosyltransferase family 2 protein [Cyclobacteriaceae bacterium]